VSLMLSSSTQNGIEPLFLASSSTLLQNPI
jgi:hypothetical protein